MTTVTETAVVRRTYGLEDCNRAKCVEGDVFGAMLRDLWAAVPNPAKTGRPLHTTCAR